MSLTRTTSNHGRDARAIGGTLSVVQPLILPLFGGRTTVEVVGLMVADKDRPGYDIVRDTWKPILGEAEFDKKWNRVLHDGLACRQRAPGGRSRCQGGGLAGLAGASGSASGLEIVFVPSPSLHDGRFANDGWLQELPDPITKLTWDNPALVSPKTAEYARCCERRCGPCRLFGPLARAPCVCCSPRHVGWRRRLDTRLRPFARRPNRLGRRVRRVQGPKLRSTWLRRRGHALQTRAHVTRSRRRRSTAAWRGARRAGVDADRASIEAACRRESLRRRSRRGVEEAAGAHAEKSAEPRRAERTRRLPESTRLTSHSGKRIPTIGATSGG